MKQLYVFLQRKPLSLLLIFSCLFNTLRAQTVNPNFWNADAAVHAAVTDGNTLYMGGDFTSIFLNTGRGAALSTTLDVPSMEWPKVTDGAINVVIPDGNGGWYIGGSFTSVGGITRNRLAHFHANKTLDLDWNPSVTGGDVRALALSGSTLFVGGTFTLIGVTTRNRLAAIEAAGTGTGLGAAKSWNPNVTNGEVRVLTMAGGTLYVGGNFTQIGSYNRSCLASYPITNGTPGVIDGWSPNATGGTGGPVINSIVVSSGTIYVGGIFTTIGGNNLPRSCIAAVDGFGSGIGTWNPNFTGTEVRALALSSNTLYVGGTFTQIGLQSRTNMAALNLTNGNSITTTWAANSNGVVNALALSSAGDTLFVGGSFIDIGQPRNRIAALNAGTGAVFSGWDPNADGAVLTLAIWGNTVYAGSASGIMARKTYSRLAAIDLTTGLPKVWNHGAAGTVRALALSGNTVYAGGSFTSVNGIIRRGIAAFNKADGTLNNTWNPNALVSGFEGIVYTLAASVSGDTVYAGGNFDNIGGQSRNRLAALDAVGVGTGIGAAKDWNPAIVGTAIRALTVSGGTLYVGGIFTQASGVTRSRLASFSDGTLTSWNPSADNTVLALAIAGNTVYIGGSLTAINTTTTNTPRNYIAAVNATTGIVEDWNPNASVNVAVRALAVAGNIIYAGGDFTSFGSGAHTRIRLAAFNSGDNIPLAWNPSAGANVNTLALSGTSLYAGGGFSSVSNQVITHLAAISTIAPTPLPVRVVSFSALPQLRSVKLHWQVADEDPYTTYELQRSKGVEAFITLGRIKDNVLNKGHYSYTDNTVQEGSRYCYRLKITAPTGAVHYSTILMVDPHTDSQQVKVYPTVVKNNSILAQVPQAGYWLQLFNTSGQVVVTQPLTAGVQQVSLPNLPNGIYTYKLSANGQQSINTSGQLIIQ